MPGGSGSCAWAFSTSVRDDSVDFPNPILTCIDCVGLPVSHMSGYEKSGKCRASSDFLGKCMLHLLSEGWMHAIATNSFVRLRTSHTRGREGGLSHDGYQRKAYCNLKPTHILLALHRSSGRSASMGRGATPPREEFDPVCRGLRAVQAYVRRIYQLHFAVCAFSNLDQVGLKTTRQFIHSISWAVAHLWAGAIHHFQAQSR